MCLHKSCRGRSCQASNRIVQFEANRTYLCTYACVYVRREAFFWDWKIIFDDQSTFLMAVALLLEFTEVRSPDFACFHCTSDRRRGVSIISWPGNESREKNGEKSGSSDDSTTQVRFGNKIRAIFLTIREAREKLFFSLTGRSVNVSSIVPVTHFVIKDYYPVAVIVVCLMTLFTQVRTNLKNKRTLVTFLQFILSLNEKDFHLRKGWSPILSDSSSLLMVSLTVHSISFGPETT